MAIEIIDTLSQKNNGNFALVDSNDIKGGYYQVESIEERDNIPAVRRKVGMLCYVENDTNTGIIYQLKGGLDNSNWHIFEAGSSSSSIECDVNKEYVDTQLDLKANREYVDSELSLKADKDHTHDSLYPQKDEVYTIDEVDGLIAQIEIDNSIHIGDEAPTDSSIVWVDTSEIYESNPVTDDILDEIRASFSKLQEKIDILSKKNIELESRISYLEMFGSGGGSSGGGSSGDSDDSLILTLEDGTELTFETGEKLTFEKESPNDSLVLSLEDKTEITLEDGKKLTFEKGMM